MRACASFLIVASSSYAIAGGLVIAGGSPRSIGRAGVGVVGDDGVGALLVNPAGMARREAERAQIGLAFTDDEIAWLGSSDAPVARNQSASDFAPYAAAIGSFDVAGATWVVGLGAMTSAVSDRALRPPSDLPPGEFGKELEFRYAGIAGAFQRDTVTLGIARRIGESVAVGAAFGASRVTISERRRVWAGFNGRDVIGDPLLDVEVSLAGTDWFAPSVVGGVLVAPSEAPLELAASVTWLQTIEMDGEVGARTADTPMAPAVVANEPGAHVRVRQPVTVRAGGRYVGEKFVAEVGGDVWIAAASASETTWRTEGIRVIDRSGVVTNLTRVPSRMSMRTHGAIRAAVDVELIGGFLWLTGGYAYQVAGVAETRQSPSFGDLGGHTAALGLEGSAGGFTFTLGWSRTWSPGRRTDTVLALDNPFGTGDSTVPRGTYGGSSDQVGILVDAEWDADD